MASLVERIEALEARVDALEPPADVVSRVEHLEDVVSKMDVLLAKKRRRYVANGKVGG